MSAVLKVEFIQAEDNLARHGQDVTAGGSFKNDAEIEKANIPHNEKNNFSQYGAWVMSGNQGRTTMYTRDREGITDLPLPYGVKPDTQAASCGTHIVFGHGPDLDHFRKRDFRSVNNLAIDNKVKSSVYFEPHFQAEAYLSHLDQTKKSQLPGDQTLAQTKSLIHTHDSYRPINPHLSRYGEVETLKDARKTTGFKFYDDFTKRFDQSHLNTKLRAPQYIN